MQHQILFFDSAYLCPPPSQPLLRPQTALLPDDDFQLEDFCLAKTETMLPESPATSASYCGELEEELTIEEGMEDESSCYKRSLREMHGFGAHRYAKSVLMKLETMDRRQLCLYPDPLSDATSDLLSLISRISAKFQKGLPRNSHPIVFECPLQLTTDNTIFSSSCKGYPIKELMLAINEGFVGIIKFRAYTPNFFQLA